MAQSEQPAHKPSPSQHEAAQHPSKPGQHARAENVVAGGHGEAHGGGHGDPMIGWKWANFALLALGLGYLIKKNSGAFFATRTAAIQKDIAEARRMREDAEARAAEMERRLNALDQEIAEIRVSLSREIAAEGDRIRGETARSIARIQATAEQEISAATKAARQQLKHYSAQLAIELADEKIRSRMGPPVQRSLVHSFVDNLARQRERVH